MGVLPLGALATVWFLPELILEIEGYKLQGWFKGEGILGADVVEADNWEDRVDVESVRDLESEEETVDAGGGAEDAEGKEGTEDVDVEEGIWG